MFLLFGGETETSDSASYNKMWSGWLGLEQNLYYPTSYQYPVHCCLQSEGEQYWLHTKHSSEWADGRELNIQWMDVFIAALSIVYNTQSFVVSCSGR